MQRCEVVEQETRERERLCFSFQDALGVVMGLVASGNHKGTVWEIWAVADDAAETRVARYAEIITP